MFWRDGALRTIDADLRQRILLTQPDDRAVMSRILLHEHGTITFALGNELHIVHDTDLAPLADGPWPCADGNTHGNPVLSP